MYDFFLTYKDQLLRTVGIIFILVIFQIILKKAANKVGKRTGINLTRTKLMFKYINILVLIIAFFLFSFAWGMDLGDLSIVFSSAFAVIGVALFAIWSILSNVTSGIIMFFSFPYRIGDKIKIHDKDMPIEAVIEDIRAFHLHLRTDDGELTTYPNNLILQKAVTLLQKDVYLDEGKDSL